LAAFQEGNSQPQKLWWGGSIGERQSRNIVLNLDVDVTHLKKLGC